ncbi:MAG: DUF2183 domain-containing protein [Gemmatimonadetes bacterium]|nr:DUF2183 domain-containing protein [Gemmatimonadota bacterium]
MSDSGEISRTRRALRAGARSLNTAKRAVERRFGLFDPLEVLAYRSEGRPDRLRVRGRIVERQGVQKSGGEQSLLRNITNTIRRLESDEIPGARVSARFRGAEARGETDAEGFFEMEVRPSAAVEPGWQEVELELLGSMAGGEGLKATAEVLVPSPAAEFVVVSDLDDTVIRTGATRTWRKIRSVFGNSATSRSMMPGAAPLYQALEWGADGNDAEDANPFFYVSKSGWGLYDLFVEFLDQRGFPRGGMYLQDLALIEDKSEKLGSENHKLDTINALMDDYPDLPFVLIGDSGQHDPELYRDIVRDRPDRVRAVLVRDVTPQERDREVRRVVEEVQSMGVLMAAAESSVSLARAAADFDLVPHSAIDAVRRKMVEGDEE